MKSVVHLGWVDLPMNEERHEDKHETTSCHRKRRTLLLLVTPFF